MHRRPHRNRLSSNGTSKSADTLISNNVVLAIVVPAAVFITIANGAVVLTIIRRRSLQKLRNMPLLSLAVADLIVGLVLAPLFIATHISPENEIMCKVHLVFEAFCFTASLLNMFVTSIERWIAIFRPLRYSRYITPASIWAMIGVAWVLTLVTALLRICFRCRIARRRCMWVRQSTGVFPAILCFLFIILAFVMGVMQTRIYRVVRYHCLKITPVTSRSTTGNLQPISSENEHAIAKISTFKTSNEASRKDLFSNRAAPVEESTSTARRIVISARQQDCDVASSNPEITVQYSRHGNATPCDDAVGNNKITTAQIHVKAKRVEVRSQREDQEIAVGTRDNNNEGSRNATFVSSFQYNTDEDKLTVIAQSSNEVQTSTASLGRLSTSSKAKKQHRLVINQQRTTASAVSILYMVFILMWTPYLILTLLRSLKICGQACVLGDSISRFLLLFNSAANPLIYTIRIQEFRRAIKEFMCRK